MFKKKKFQLSSYTNVLFLVLANSTFINFCETEQVVNYTKVTETLTITSPDYPNIQYSINKSCSIQVSLQQVPLQQVVLHILHQSAGESQISECNQDYNITDINNTPFPNKQRSNHSGSTQCCSILEDILLTEVHDDLIVYLPAGTRPGFTFTFTGRLYLFLKTLNRTFF